MNSKIIEKIRQDLRDLKGKYEIVVYGSQIAGGARPNSDIDIAVITHVHDEGKKREIWNELLKYNVEEYDIKVFELLSLRIKASVIENYEVVFGNPLDISEYFYHYRKLWDDCKHRIFENQFKSFRERMKQRKRYLEIHNE